MNFCPNCGKPIVNKDDSFCSNCGHALQLSAPAVPAAGQEDLLDMIASARTEQTAPPREMAEPPVATGGSVPADNMPTRQMPVGQTLGSQAQNNAAFGQAGAQRPEAPRPGTETPVPAQPEEAPPAGERFAPIKVAFTDDLVKEKAESQSPSFTVIKEEGNLRGERKPFDVESAPIVPLMQPDAQANAEAKPRAPIFDWETAPVERELAKEAKEDAPAGNAPASQASFGHAVTGQAPAGQAPALQASAEKLPAQEKRADSPAPPVAVPVEALPPDEEFAAEAASPTASAVAQEGLFAGHGAAPEAAPEHTPEQPAAEPEATPGEAAEKAAVPFEQAVFQQVHSMFEEPAQEKAADTPVAQSAAPAPRPAARPAHPAHGERPAQRQQPRDVQRGGDEPTQQMPAQRMPQRQGQQAKRQAQPNLFDDAPAKPGPRVAAPARPLPPPVNLPEPDDEPREGAGRIVTRIVVVVLVFLLAVSATTMVMLYMGNRPGKLVDEFVAAVAAKDMSKLSGLLAQKKLVLNDADSTEENWTALCNAFQENDEQKLLKSHLLKVADGVKEGEALDYPAVTMESEPFFLFIKRYRVEVSGVSLLAPSAQPGYVLRLDTVTHEGTAAAQGGMLYSGLMPGRYECRVVPPGTDAQTVAAEEITIFSVGEPNVLETREIRANVTVANCRSDDAILYVNDDVVAEKPVGGVVTLTMIPLGSTIRISIMEDGTNLEATAVFSDAQATDLSFGDYTEVAPPPAGEGEGEGGGESESQSESASQQPENPLSEGDINAVLSGFYTSYLESINAQDIGKLTGATSSCATEMGSRIKSSGNAENLFEYVSAACVMSTVKVTEANGSIVLEFDANFKYRYKPREGEGSYTDASNTQSVQLVQQDGQWKVNKLVRK